ncbi:MAG: isoprenylcysteine carboxylmethyltransferase family protein [Chloroflexota bacterium]|nr:isoprenylcysteine carboxylmethyltransferase family protein [Chloroflexota bacterium]
MSLIPAFEIGLWNAWIFMLVEVLTIPVFLRIVKNRQSPSSEKAMAGMSRVEKIILYGSKVMFVPALIYSIFLPLKLGTMWFYIGLPITLIGLITRVMVLVNWATTPPDEPVTRGLYRYSRHPMYVTAFLMHVGLGIACASWVFLLFAVVFTVVSFVYADAEEQLTLEMYSDSYREYMKRTSKYIGIPKSRKK